MLYFTDFFYESYIFIDELIVAFVFPLENRQKKKTMIGKNNKSIDQHLNLVLCNNFSFPVSQLKWGYGINFFPSFNPVVNQRRKTLSDSEFN